MYIIHTGFYLVYLKAIIMLEISPGVSNDSCPSCIFIFLSLTCCIKDDGIECSFSEIYTYIQYVSSVTQRLLIIEDCYLFEFFIVFIFFQ